MENLHTEVEQTYHLIACTQYMTNDYEPFLVEVYTDGYSFEHVIYYRLTVIAEVISTSQLSRDELLAMGCLEEVR